ncbi:MAG: hypothetical protein NDJ90_15025, partial [Oligoflexia bacterium]|nr:hypothetical protein [Oligoflexia bacterium]
LIDDLTISGSLGYFRALDGYANVMPTAGGNVTLLRSYTHVRPIASIEEGAREKWQNLFVAKFMKDLGKVLEQEPPVPGAPAPGEGEEPRRHPLDEFLSGLKEGEVFTITDTLAGGANLQGMSPISALAGLAPLNFVNTLSVGVDASLVGLRQTVFLKTSTGLQVLVRGMTNQAAGAQLDSNFFLNLLHARASLTNSDIATDAYVIDYNTDLSLLAGDDRTAGGEPDPKLERLRKRRQDLQSALRLLFKKNDSSLFESAFADRRFELDHELKTRAFNFKFLTERMNTFSESHELKLRYPVNPDYPELNPADEEVTLYSYKKGELVGRDLLGFLFDLVEGLAERPGTIARVDNPNPANTPFGKAYWRIVNTESDLTTNAGPPGAPNAAYPSVGIIQHVWGGWNLKHDALMKLVAEISARIPQNELGSYRIVEPEFFATTQSLDYYRITQNLSILQGGMDRLRDLVLQPSAGKKGDRAFFKDLMKLLGDGDALLGERIYVENCQAELRARAVEAGLVTSQVRISGNSYECLSPWTQDLLRMRRTYSVSDRRAQTEWMTELLGTLEANIPLSQLLGYIDRSNYSFSVRFNGFRTGDEDGDLEFVSNTSGDPARDFDTSNGLFQLYANKTGITPVELDRSNGSFR